MTRRIALGIFLLAIIFFLMPWVNVSCGGQQIFSASGLDMVRGVYNVPGAYSADSPGSYSQAIWALVAAGAGLLFSLFAWKPAFLLRILAGLAGIALLVALKIKLGHDFNNSAIQGNTDITGMIQLNYSIGYWLTLVAFAAATVVSSVNKKITVNITDSAAKTPIPSGPPPTDKPPPS